MEFYVALFLAITAGVVTVRITFWLMGRADS
jgi:hypothetical protein